MSERHLRNEVAEPSRTRKADHPGRHDPALVGLQMVAAAGAEFRQNGNPDVLERLQDGRLPASWPASLREQLTPHIASLARAAAAQLAGDTNRTPRPEERISLTPPPVDKTARDKAQREYEAFVARQEAGRESGDDGYRETDTTIYAPAQVGEVIPNAEYGLPSDDRRELTAGAERAADPDLEATVPLRVPAFLGATASTPASTADRLVIYSATAFDAQRYNLVLRPPVVEADSEATQVIPLGIGYGDDEPTRIVSRAETFFHGSAADVYDDDPTAVMGPGTLFMPPNDGDPTMPISYTPPAPNFGVRVDPSEETQVIAWPPMPGSPRR